MLGLFVQVEPLIKSTGLHGALAELGNDGHMMD